MKENKQDSGTTGPHWYRERGRIYTRYGGPHRGPSVVVVPSRSEVKCENVVCLCAVRVFVNGASKMAAFVPTTVTDSTVPGGHCLVAGMASSESQGRSSPMRKD